MGMAAIPGQVYLVFFSVITLYSGREEHGLGKPQSHQLLTVQSWVRHLNSQSFSFLTIERFH